jgi:hypothetical protein
MVTDDLGKGRKTTDEREKQVADRVTGDGPARDRQRQWMDLFLSLFMPRVSRDRPVSTCLLAR